MGYFKSSLTWKNRLCNGGKYEYLAKKLYLCLPIYFFVGNSLGPSPCLKQVLFCFENTRMNSNEWFCWFLVLVIINSWLALFWLFWSKLGRVGVQTRALFSRRVTNHWYFSWGKARLKDFSGIFNLPVYLLISASCELFKIALGMM